MVNSSDLISITALIISGLTFIFIIIKYVIDRNITKTKNRLNALNNLVSGLDLHNWQFVYYWDFPGVYPYISDQNTNPTNISKNINDENEKRKMGQRVVVLSHLNILLKVYIQKKNLNANDIAGYQKWARSWINNCEEPLRAIFNSGDVYPLDFIKWLEKDLLKDEDIKKFYGVPLKDRFALVDDKGLISHFFWWRKK